MDFYDLDLDDHILDALDAMNFATCTPIQEQAIPPLLEHRDLIGVAQTGTGKTAAYLLPVLQELNSGDYPQDAINCIVMSPTRELAQQIDQQVEGFAYFIPVSSVAVYGGNDGIRYEQERNGLRQGADIVIATPGRLISHIATGNVDLSQVSFFILDEADRMLDMGFYEDIMKIASYLPKERQTIMFSATMPENIQRLANHLLTDPVEIKIAVSKPAENIRQLAYICHEEMKNKILTSILADKTLDRVIVFVSKKTKVREVTQTLRKAGLNVAAMHSDLTQAERDDIMLRFKNRHISVLVATDIVSRGIDIDDIQMVINFDVPKDPEDYVHRIGRTARANRDGIGISLVCPKDFPSLDKIERLIEASIDKPSLPEGCGESPEYSAGTTKGRRNNPGRRRGKHENKKSKPSEATASQPKMDSNNTSNTENRAKKKRRRHSKKRNAIKIDKNGQPA